MSMHLVRPSLLLVVGLVAIFVAPAEPACAVDLLPIATTGHDQDIIFESGLAAGAVAASGELGSRQFFEDGATSATDDGLPRTLPAFTAATGNVITYGFAPFEGSNILKFDDLNAATTKTLTLTTPAPYTNLAVVFAGGSLATATEFAGVAYTINYAGGLTQTGTFSAPDWGAVTNLPAGTERLFIADRTTANATTWPVSSDNNTTANRWAIYVSEIVSTQPGANVLSVAFGPITLNDADGLLNAGDDVAIFGIAGGRVVPEPATWLLGLLGAAALCGAGWKRQRCAAA